MSDFTIKQGNIYPPIVGYLKVNGAVLPDIANATGVMLILAKRSDPTYFVLQRSGTIVDTSTGKVVYNWTPGDTDVPDDYVALWRVTYPGGGTRDVPTIGTFSVTIEPVPQQPPP